MSFHYEIKVDEVVLDLMRFSRILKEKPARAERLCLTEAKEVILDKGGMPFVLVLIKTKEEKAWGGFLVNPWGIAWFIGNRIGEKGKKTLEYIFKDFLRMEVKETKRIQLDLRGYEQTQDIKKFLKGSKRLYLLRAYLQRVINKAIEEVGIKLEDFRRGDEREAKPLNF